MFRVDNKKVINNLAKRIYAAHKKRNILTITAIFLTTFLICTVLSVGLRYWKTLDLRRQRMQGMDYDIGLTEPKDEQIDAIRKMKQVKYAGVCVKCAVLSGYGQKDLDKVKMFWLDDICWEKQTIPALERYTGHYPQKENEIMLSESTLRELGIDHPQVGMELPIRYQTLAEAGGEEELEKTFVLSGWFLDYSGRNKGYVGETFYRSTGVRKEDMTQGELKISLKSPFYTEGNITEMQNAIHLSRNQIMDADYDTISNFCKTVAGLFFLLLLIFASGYLFIYNTLYISVRKDIRFYGQLKTLGTTSSQIRSLLDRQIRWNTGLGIPLGLICSAVVGKIVIPQLLHALNPSLMAKDVEAASMWVFAVAAVFSFATTAYGARQPARTAMECSPVEAMRYVGTSLAKRKNRIRQGGDIGSMVRLNLFRDKKQFFIILCSLSLALSLCLIMNIVIRANRATDILNRLYDYDLRILNRTLLSEQEEQVITEELIRDIKNVEGVKNVRILKAVTATVPYQKDVYGQYYKALYRSRYSPGEYDRDMEMYAKKPDYDHNMFSCRIVGIDEGEFERLNRKVKKPLDQEAFRRGEVAFASRGLIKGEYGIPGKKVRFFIPAAENRGKEEGVVIGALTEQPAYYSAGYSPDLIVSDRYLEEMAEQPLIEMIKVDYEEAFSRKTEESILGVIDKEKSVSVDSKLDRYSEMKNTENQMAVLGGSIGVIVMMLAISNYVNMMSAGIQNRSGEFAILESIGMTQRQIRRMVVSESLYYGICSIAISLILGLSAGYFTFKNFNRYGVPFSFPIGSTLLLFLTILWICPVSALVLLKKMKGESIIELLRRREG